MEQLTADMSFDDLLKDAVRDYYERFGKRHPAEFAALLIAIGGMKTVEIAWDSIVEGEVSKKVAYGALATVALKYGMKYVLSGPLGIIATGLTVAGMAHYVMKNQSEVRPLALKFREVIEGAQAKYGDLADGLDSGRLTPEEQEMIAEGIRSKLIQALIGVTA